MKIILAAKSVYPFHPFGGVQKYVYYFAKHLALQGMDVEVVAPTDAGKQPRQEKYEGITYTLLDPCIEHYLELPIGWWGVHQFSFSLARYLKQQQFDVLHSFDMVGLQYAQFKDRQPVVAHIFTDNFLSNPISLFQYASLFGHKTAAISQPKQMLSPWDGFASYLQYPAQYLFKVNPMHRYLQASDLVVVEDDSFRHNVAATYRLPAPKMAVLPVGVDMAAMATRLKEPAKISRKDLRISDDAMVLLTVNRLAADKGVDNAVRALKVILKTKVPARLVIIGKGYGETALHELIRQENLAEYVVHIKDVPEDQLPEYYRLADAYICAFSYPGSSVSSLEAMAAGLPIVTTAQPWLVKEEADGIVIKDNQPATIAAAVLTLANTCRIKSKIVSPHVHKYDWSTITHQAIAKYRQLQKTGTH